MSYNHYLIYIFVSTETVHDSYNLGQIKTLKGLRLQKCMVFKICWKSLPLQPISWLYLIADSSVWTVKFTCLEGLKFPGGYSTLSWVRMCGPKFRPPPYNKTREDTNFLPISNHSFLEGPFLKPISAFYNINWDASTFWQPIDKPKDKFIGNYAFCKNATYI